MHHYFMATHCARRASPIVRCIAALVVCASTIAVARADVATNGLSPTSPHTWRVGPAHPLKRIAEAAALARDGDTVVIEPGDYPGDVATWAQSNLTIRAAKCCARITAEGKSAEKKAIWVFKGDRIVVENVVLEGARADDRNGAGIRHEGGSLVVRNSRFLGNEMGIMTWNAPHAELLVERSEFAHNRIAGPLRLDPVGHQIYVGRIARFTLRDSYVHHGWGGHLVKSRARESNLYCNRLTDEAEGRSSYEAEFPDGGVVTMVGNIVAQSPDTDNETLIAFGAERYFWPDNTLRLVNNTLVDSRARRRPLLRIRPGATSLVIANNLLVGVASTAVESLSSQARAEPFDVPRLRESDFRLHQKSRLVGTAHELDSPGTSNLRPACEYLHPHSSRSIPRQPYSPGAMQSRIDSR